MQDKLAELRALVYCEPPDELFTDEKRARLCELFADVTALDTRAMLAEYLFGHEVTTTSGMRGVFVPSRISAGGVGVSLLLWRRVATGFEVERRDIAGKPEPTTWSAYVFDPDAVGLPNVLQHVHGVRANPRATRIDADRYEIAITLGWSAKLPQGARISVSAGVVAWTVERDETTVVWTLDRFASTWETATLSIQTGTGFAVTVDDDHTRYDDHTRSGTEPEEPEATGMTGTGLHLWAGFHLDLQGGGFCHFGQRTPIEAHITTEFTSPVPDHRHIVVEYGDPFPPDLDVLVDTVSGDGSAELDGGHILRVRVPWHEPGPVLVTLYTVEVDRGVMPEGSLGAARRELVEQVRELVGGGADFEEAQRRINELNEELHQIIYSRTRPGACPVCGEHALVELDDVDDGAACLACEIQRARETR